MFSNFRNVVENLAQPQPRPSKPQRTESQDQTGSDRPGEHTRGSASFDLSSVAHSTGHLAESAFSNLRKSLAAQRPFTVTSPTVDGSGRASPQTDRELKPVSKPTLEDRLRASFAIGDLSVSPSPGPSQSASPKPPSQVTEDLSPHSIPLPSSPVQTDVVDTPALSHLLADDPHQDIPESGSRDEPRPEPEIAPEVSNPEEQEVLVDNGVGKTDENPDESKRYPEADVPLPLLSPIPTNLAATQSMHSLQNGEVLQQQSEDHNLPNERLDSLEKMYSETSKALEELRIAQTAINTVLAEFTPVSTMLDANGLKEHLQSLHAIQSQSQEEIKRLNGRLRNYDERIEELRDTHRLESRSQTELVDSLRKQLEESESLLKAAQSSSSQSEQDIQQVKAELEQVRGELQKRNDTVKEEEEKRTKAISLLKTVRQKLVKAEKDKDEAVKDLGTLKEQNAAERAKERAEQARLEKEAENIRAEKERDINGLKAHFDRELASLRDRLEKDFATRKAQIDANVTTLKSNFQKESASKDTKIQMLENSVRSLNAERDSLFDQLQIRQGELESSQSHLETLQSNTSELQYQLKEAIDRSALLIEELADARRELEYRELKPVATPNDASAIRAAIEAKYEAKISDLSSRLSAVERDRNEMEAALSRSLQQKSQEIDALRKQIDDSALSKGYSDDEMLKSKQEIESLQHQLSVYKEEMVNLDLERNKVNELEARLQSQANELKLREEQHGKELAEIRDREAHIRGLNKNLRDDLRKVQNSAALLEKQRNPGVGYWSMTRNGSTSETRLSSPPASTAALPSPRIGTPSPNQQDPEEEVNLEYLRNVILQFLEHKDMRPHLVRVLSIILHFTPQETRRLVAKVGS